MELDERFEREGIVPAALGKRAVAYFLDDLLVSIVVIIMMWGSLSQAQSFEQYIQVTNSAFFEIVVIRFLYQFIFVLMYGATIGKMVMKMKVIDCSYLDKPQVQGALIRAAIRTVGEVFFYFTFIFAFFDPLKRALHDRWANTAVVNVL